MDIIKLLEKLKQWKKVKEKIAEVNNKLTANLETASIIEPNKSNWQDFESVLNQKNIQYLVHFTDISNLDSIILNGGLYSWDYCEKNNINIPSPGGSKLSRKLDLRKNLQNYVRLCFVIDHPMLHVAIKEGRIMNPIVLLISREVIYWNGTRYSDINATTEKEIAKIGDSIEHLNNINFEIFRRNYFDLDYYDKMKYQAEVLVFERIPINYITKIYDISLQQKEIIKEFKNILSRSRNN